MTTREILVAALSAQKDFGIKDINQILADYDNDPDNMLNNLPEDSVAKIVVNAIISNEPEEGYVIDGEDALNSMVNGLDYALAELTRARNAVAKIYQNL